MLKAGIAVIECPECDGIRPHTVVVLGEEVFVCCRHCKALRVAEGDDRPLADEQPGNSARFY